jgi:hypothetical protein
MLVKNKHFSLFQLLGNLLKTKKCVPYFGGITEFYIYLCSKYYQCFKIP